MNPIGLYLHIPFCKARCYYCDFNTYAGMEQYFEEYVQALIQEMKLYNEEYGKVSIKSVFIGGGTPTILHSTQIERIVEGIHEYFALPKDLEFSIESNPGTLSLEKLQVLKAIGINRLSMGLQAVQNSLLRQIGRIHTFEDFLENYYNSRKVGFDNINADLIFSLPEQTMEQWKESIRTLIDLDLDHISAYSLILEQGTRFYREYEKGELIPVDEDIDRKMNDIVVEEMLRAGYCHYEISNFAKPQKECRQNVLYWQAEEYFGLGSGAHGYYNNIRYSNTLDVETYIKRIGFGQKSMIHSEAISLQDAMGEFMMLGLRMIEGIEKERFTKRFGKDLHEVYGSIIEKYKKMNLIEETSTRIKFTRQGIDISNRILSDFLL